MKESMGGAGRLQHLKPRNLRQGLILIVLVALLPIVLVSILQGISTIDDARTLAARKLDATARVIAERNRAPFIIGQHLLATVAANSDVRDMTAKCSQALTAVGQNYPPIVNFIRSDASGNIRCSAMPLKLGTDFSGQSWWQSGIRSDGMTISAPVLGFVSLRQVLILMQPIRDADGNQDGAITTGVDIAYLNKAAKQARENKRGIIAIVTDDGRTVARGNQKLPFTPDTNIKPDAVGTAETVNGDIWLYATAPIYGPDLHVVYAEYQKPLLATAVAQTRASILLPIVSILLASLAIWLGTHRLVVRWLCDLGRVVGGFAKGDFTGDRAHFERAPAEIAELSAGLHTMADGFDRQTRELNLALEAKNDLTREVHHRVKNNLQIITSLLTLQASRVQEPIAQQVLGQTRARISALALIHRLLYQQDPENESERGKVAVANLLEELCIQLRSANRDRPGVDLKCEASSHSISADQAVPLALFAVEALTNAYRHAFTNIGRGWIVLRFLQAGDNGVLTIQDNGIGFDANDDDIGQMGLELMNAFASQLSGSVEIKSTVNSGSEIALSFPALSVLHA